VTDYQRYFEPLFPGTITDKFSARQAWAISTEPNLTAS
jgi:hypothetical protein